MVNVKNNNQVLSNREIFRNNDAVLIHHYFQVFSSNGFLLINNHIVHLVLRKHSCIFIVKVFIHAGLFYYFTWNHYSVSLNTKIDNVPPFFARFSHVLQQCGFVSRDAQHYLELFLLGAYLILLLMLRILLLGRHITM